LVWLTQGWLQKVNIRHFYKKDKIFFAPFLARLALKFAKYAHQKVI